MTIQIPQTLIDRMKKFNWTEEPDGTIKFKIPELKEPTYITVSSWEEALIACIEIASGG